MWLSRFLSFFTFGMSVLFLSDFTHDILLMPLNSFRIRSIFSCRFVLFLSLMHFFDPLVQFFQLVFVSFRVVSLLFNESSDLIVSFPGLFIFSCDLDITSFLFIFLWLLLRLYLHSDSMFLPHVCLYPDSVLLWCFHLHPGRVLLRRLCPNHDFVLLLLQQRVCTQLVLFQQLRRSCLHSIGLLLWLPHQVSHPHAGTRFLLRMRLFEWCAASFFRN